MLNILVSGGLGYIGSILTRDLLDEKYKVTVIDNNIYKENSLADLYINENLTLINGDIRNYKLMSSIISNFDIIIPLAALVGAPLCAKEPLAASSINKDAMFWLFKNISKDQVILMPTTNSAYGTGNKDNYCDENSKLNPISKYAIDKVQVEEELLNLKNAISLRLATVFGMSPRMRLDLLVNDFVYRAVKDRFIVIFEGHFKRNYIHVRDVARCFLHCIKNFEKMNNEIFNVGLSNANLSKIELCKEIKKQIPAFNFFESELNKDPDQRNYIVSNLKIEKTGFHPIINLDKGIQELIKGFTFFDDLNYKNA